MGDFVNFRTCIFIATICNQFFLCWAMELQQIRENYTAAVYEHKVIFDNDRRIPLTRQQALSAMMKNIDVYRQQTKLAALQGADIIVFPEDGLCGPLKNITRNTIHPYLEEIPDASDPWNPCQHPYRYPGREIQVALSCMARDNRIYVVANMGDKQPCDANVTGYCPVDGRYQYNTDVVYDPSGNLVAKYHKRHLFFEFQFDTPPSQVVTFDTPFGRFGVFTCFDILFEHPAVDLIQTYNITNIAFPTAWMDAVPFLTSVQFHSSFAMRHGVNFLAANIHHVARNFHGSGIYTPDGATAYYFNTTVSSGGKLVVQTISNVRKPNKISITTDLEQHQMPLGTQKSYSVKMFDDYHNVVPLTNPLREAIVCHNDLCCNVSYSEPTSSRHRRQVPLSKNQALPANGEFYSLSAFSDTQSGATYYLQICSLVRCRTSNGSLSCGDLDATSMLDQDLTSFTLYGNFSSPYVYPQIILGGEETLELTSYPRQWSSTNVSLTTNAPFKKRLGVASLLGRPYQRDRYS